MAIRWRLTILILQLGVIAFSTYELTGKPYTADTWFTAGLLAIIINPQLLEPWYPRPADVLGNSIIGTALFLMTTRDRVEPGWNLLLVFLLVALTLSVAAIAFGRPERTNALSRIGHFATIISRVATSRTIYSSVFLLAALEYRPVTSADFWVLLLTWTTVTALGVINWQNAFAALSGGPSTARGQGMLGPSTLCIASPTLPPSGTTLRVECRGASAQGLLLNRFVRDGDLFGHVFIPDAAACETLSRSSAITLRNQEAPAVPIVGSVLPASSDTKLEFCASVPLETGSVVSAPTRTGPILYQVRYAEIEQAIVKGGAHQVVRAHAAQVGVFDSATSRFRRHRWVPEPGGPVSVATAPQAPVAKPAGWFQVGTLTGTTIPVFLDSHLACEGHVAILGMTRMGKSTVAKRLAEHLASSHRVTILDVTSEWTSKKGLPRYTNAEEDSKVGVSVFEPKIGESAPQVGLKYLQSIIKLAHAEYKIGDPFPRVLIVDEAHQFVPEPAGLGFNNPDRDAASQFGQLMMQIRKYRITIVLISQRTAVVAKSALSQCENVLAFKSVDQTGLEYLEAVLGGDARRALPSLSIGHALAGGPAFSTDLTVELTLLAN